MSCRLPSPLYAILDTSFSKSRLPITILREFLTGGVRLVQLRAKELSSGEFFTLAREARQLTREAGATFIVNDRADIALACHADGVHLGQDDLPLAAARKVLGPEKIIGISTHDLDQARSAELNGADYIGFGPIFGSTTKDTGYSPRGLEMLREIRKAVKIPIVAIGGINEKNVAQVWEAGADAAAIISDLVGEGDVTAKAKKILMRRLRQRLDEIAGRSTEDTAVHHNRVQALGATCPHSIKYIEKGGGDRSDCMVYALKIPFDLVNDVATFPSMLDEFYTFALPRVLEQIPDSEVSTGLVILYFKDGKTTHVARLYGDRAISKWGENPVYEHDILEVPASYGNEYKFFKQPSARYITDKFIEFVRRHERYIDIRPGFEASVRSWEAEKGS